MTFLLASSAVCAPGPPEPGWVAIDDGLIIDRGSGPPPVGALDAGSALLAPGLIDLQVNGVDDDDFATADAAGWRRAARAQLERGVTAFCPTLVTAPLDRYDDALEHVSAARHDLAGAPLPSVLGVHLEGPFLGGAPGAHPVDLVRAVDLAWLQHLLAAFPDVVTIVTLAPEADPGLAATRFLSDRGVTVALGHSTATYDEVHAAADAGARLVTHLFNGMAPLHHREPGLAGAALEDERLTPTLIADLVHVHPAALRLAIAHKRNVALVTDRVATVGLRVSEDGTARLADGTIAGSTLTMDGAVRNVVATGVAVERAIEMATVIPAGALGLTDRGRLAPGTRADIVAFDPASLAVRGVWVTGELAFGAPTGG
ncbi:MAG TPA: amidohydrolase family protein [Acidimicrobiia bacterium]|nr:amidohydrolase family protein [Acidimicrobiia bacterium]